MKKIIIESLNYTMLLDKSIKTIYIENSKLYQLLSLNTEESITYIVNDNIVDLTKNALILYNHFQININDSKLVKALYKKIEKEIKIKYKENLNKFEQTALQFLSEISLEEIVELDYEEEIDISKLLASFNVNYKVSDNYFERLVNYFRIYRETFNNTLIISFGLLNLLEEQEVELLKKELLYLDVVLIDVIYSNKKFAKDLIIDDDWCII